MVLAPCPDCRRHVAVVEAQCPFCAGPLDALRAAPRRAGRRYVGKGATAIYLTALAAGCSATTTEPARSDAALDTAADVLEFDGYALDGGTDTGVASDSRGDASDVADEGGPFPIYK